MANAFHAFRLTKLALFLIIFVAILLILSWRNNNFVVRLNVVNDKLVSKYLENSQVLVIQGNCIEKLATNGQCKFPIEIAIFKSNSSKIPEELVKNENYLKIIWTIEDQPKKDFWLFREEKNTTNVIALKKFTTRQTKITIQNNSQFLVAFPADFAKFQKNWRNGRFLECEILLKRNETEIQRFMPLTMIERAAELTAHMDKFNITGILFGGTLLGWRRECSLIPHTGDLDFVILYREHSLPFLESILHSQKFLLKWMLGHPKKGFEMTIWMDNFKTDIFYMYYNETRGQSFITGMRVEKKQRLYWYYPKVEELCTGEMSAHLFHLPCNVDDILAIEYGTEGWKVDFPTSQFFYDKSHKNKESGEIIEDDEWKKQNNLYYPKEEHNQTLPNWGQ